MFFTQETPAKIFSLLGTAVFSMFLLFSVSFTNASFTSAETTFPDIFSPDNIVASLDTISSSYSKFVQANLIKPAQADYALAQDTISFVIDEAGPSILAITGLTELGQYERSNTIKAQVAGAYTEAASYESLTDSFNIDTIYDVLIAQY